MANAGETAAPGALPDVQFALPGAALRPLITSYYRVTAPGPVEDYLHPEWGNIRFTTHGSWTVTRPGNSDPTPQRCALFGPTDRTATVATPGDAAMLGVGLTALGWSMLVAQPAAAHANRMSDGAATLGEPIIALWAHACQTEWRDIPALFDAYFGDVAAAAAPPDPLIGRVQAALVDGNIATVPDFAADLGLTERTLARLCLRIFGFAPKRLLRRQRFLRTLAELGDRLDQPLSALLDGSYYDQSHFIREFKAYMGMTPLAYFHSPRQMMRRAAIERMRAVGAMVQGLHHTPS